MQFFINQGELYHVKLYQKNQITHVSFRKTDSTHWLESFSNIIYQEQGENKMFGAALVGSHLAHMRYINGLISVEPAESSTIINSGFYSENSPLPKDSQNRLRFFCLNDLNRKQLF